MSLIFKSPLWYYAPKLFSETAGSKASAKILTTRKTKKIVLFIELFKKLLNNNLSLFSFNNEVFEKLIWENGIPSK